MAISITPFFALSPTLASTHLIVDSTVDSGDLSPGDGICESALDGCTLRAAIDEANALSAAPGDLIITLPAGTYTLTLPGTGENANGSGDLDIDCHLVLEGAGEGLSIIDADGIDRVLDIQRAVPDWQVEMRDLTLTGGALPDGGEWYIGGGGGIRTWANVILRRVTISANQASHGRDAAIEPSGDVWDLVRDAEFGGRGGGIHNSGALQLIDSTVSNNASGRGGDMAHWLDEFGNTHGEGSAKDAGHGGGIFAGGTWATTTLLRTRVLGNRTGDGGSDQYWGDDNPGAGGFGGGIAVDLGPSLELTESTVSGNWTGRGGGRATPASEAHRCTPDEDDPWDFDCPSGYGGLGGAIFFRGSSYSGSPTLTVTDSTIADNWTGRSGPTCGVCLPGGPGQGGGIFVWSNLSSNSAVSFDRATVSGNISGKTDTGGYEADGTAGGLGFGIYDGDFLGIVNSTFSGNRADVAGGLHLKAFNGGTASIRDSTITDNHARVAGGIQWIGDSRDGDLLELGNSVLSGNSASDQGPDCWTLPLELVFIQSVNHNLIGGLDDCDFALLTNDHVGPGADLGPLADNGGPTLTHMPQPGSLAIDQGGDCQSVDQRGLPRITGLACDRGAVEVGVLPPTVVTAAASEVSETSATLHGSVDPNGDSTTAAFDYGTSDSYGTTADLGSIGTGHDPVPLSTDLTGLSCGTTYHFRARAANSGGTRHGDDRTFVTGACTGGPPDHLELSNLTIDGEPGEDLYQACIGITAGPNVHVDSSASTLFRALDWVVLSNDVSVGGSLTIDLVKPVGCP